MLSIGDCREHLGNDGKDLTDEEVEKLRNSLYQLAELALDDYFRSLEESGRKKDFLSYTKEK